MLTVGKKPICQQGEGICQDNEFHHPPEGGNIPQGGPSQHPRHKKEPENVGNYKPAAKGNHSVQRAAHRVIIDWRAEVLQRIEGKAEQRPEQQQPQMAEAPEVRQLRKAVKRVHEKPPLWFCTGRL